MEFIKKINVLLILGISTTLTGCDLSEADKDKLSDAQIDLEQLADQIIITFPANGTKITDPVITVRADIPSSAEAQEVSLFVDGIEISKDTDGAPWEINWPTYYNADGKQHTLLLKTVTGSGNEVRNNTQHSVTVTTDANKGLSFEEGLDGLQLKDSNSLVVNYTSVTEATNYQLSYTYEGITVEADSVDEVYELRDLSVGVYTLRYRAIKQHSDLSSLIGPWSDPVTIEVLPTDLPVIHQPKISKVNANFEVEISWEEIEKGDSYTLFFADKSPKPTIKTYELDDTSIIVSDIKSGTYDFWLKRKNTFGQESLSSETVSLNLGVYHKKFGGSGNDYAKHILSTSKGEALVLASTTSKGDSAADDWIFKLDEYGEMMWEYVHNVAGSPHFTALFELTNGNIILFGSSGTWANQTGSILLLNANGEKAWEKEYSNPNFDEVVIRGVTEREGAMYIISDGRSCSTIDDTLICTTRAPVIEKINLANGNIEESIQLPNLNDVNWDVVSSFSTTSSGDFLLSYSVSFPVCNFDFALACSAGGMAVINYLGQIKSEWYSADQMFINGRYAAESPLGGFMLTGQEMVSDGVPLALFTPSGTHSNTYLYSNAYSNQKEHIAFNKDGTMYQLVEQFSQDWPLLISLGTDGVYQEEVILSELKESAYPISLTSVESGGLIMLFTEPQEGYNNPDIVIVKIANIN